MKIKNLKNAKGNLLKEWIIKEEHDLYFILQDASSAQILNYPKANFDSDCEHHRAHRDGNKLYIPTRD